MFLCRSICALLVLSVVSAAGAKADGPSFPSILNVTENTAGTAITINGSGFGSMMPQVMLSGVQLTVTASDDTSITATLPPGLPPGGYLLAVAARKKDGKDWDLAHVALFEATLGQIGPTGPQGPQGVPGPIGAPGPAGPVGATGAQGPVGPAGTTGAQGLTGPVGATGAQGPAGPTGAAGAQGPVGPAGATGAPGLTGPQGQQGPQGPQGPQGAQGPQGPQGPAGAAGVPTPTFAAAITQQLEPVNTSDMAIVEVGTLVAYPYSVVLNGVLTVSGPAPSSFGEDVAERLCPDGNHCYQYFRLYFPYATCQWSNAQYTLAFAFTSPGLSGANETITLNSNDWCSDFGVTVPPAAPVITSISPTTTARGVPFTLTVNGSNLDIRGTYPVGINFDWNVFDPTLNDVSATQLTYLVPGEATEHLAGPVVITVQTGGGVSNQLLLTLTP